MRDTHDSHITLHGSERSGHAHRVVLLLRMLDLPYRFVSTPAQMRLSPEFLRLNPLGQVPVLEDGPDVICDSNAILVYLAKRYAPGSQWLPEEPLAAARVQRWLSIAAGEIKHGPALARIIVQWGDSADPERAAQISSRLFRFMEEHLLGNAYLAADHATIADLACYTYIAHAPEGGISLQPYPALRAWLGRMEALPRFEPMPGPPPPANA
jgi:glutathione S-transferase